MGVNSAVDNSENSGSRAALPEGPIRQSRGPRGWRNPRRRSAAECSTARQRRSLLPPSDPQIGSLLTECWYAP
jgi:hypothetical protein